MSTVAEYRKAWVSGCVPALTGAAGSVTLILYDWAPDGRVAPAAIRWAIATFLVGLITGVLSAYGVAVVPNAPPAPVVKRRSVRPTLVDQVPKGAGI